jgi:hypothetical protein
MPFWKKKPTTDPAIETYIKRSRNFMNIVAETMEEAEKRLQQSDGDISTIESLRYRLDHAVQQQERLEVPTSMPELAQHKENYLSTMRLALRKVDDIVYNGGAKMEALLAEEEALFERAEREAAEATAKNRELRRQVGLE